MANELCASGFTGSLSGVNGEYKLISVDHWTNGTYWIYKDSYFWMISRSSTLYEYPDYLVAIKSYVAGSWANGDYHAVGTWTNGNWTEGAIIGMVNLGTC
jgi:hypothetical protein